MSGWPGLEKGEDFWRGRFLLHSVSHTPKPQWPGNSWDPVPPACAHVTREAGFLLWEQEAPGLVTDGGAARSSWECSQLLTASPMTFHGPECVPGPREPLPQLTHTPDGKVEPHAPRPAPQLQRGGCQGSELLLCHLNNQLDHGRGCQGSRKGDNDNHPTNAPSPSVARRVCGQYWREGVLLVLGPLQWPQAWHNPGVPLPGVGRECSSWHLKPGCSGCSMTAPAWSPSHFLSPCSLSRSLLNKPLVIRSLPELCFQEALP